MASFFDKQKENSSFNKILLGIIFTLLLINVFIVKSLIDVASNKTINIQVPSFLESGDYIIGNTFANDNVYSMWGKVWISDIANFSYKDIRKRMEGIFPFLDPQTAFENKSNISKFVDFVETNFVTQEYKMDNIKIDKLSGGFNRIVVEGRLIRKVGKKDDDLSGFKYTYEFIVFTRNGQVYINGFKSYLSEASDTLVSKKLNGNEYVDFSSTIQTAKEDKAEEARLKKAALTQKKVQGTDNAKK